MRGVILEVRNQGLTRCMGIFLSSEARIFLLEEVGVDWCRDSSRAREEVLFLGYWQRAVGSRGVLRENGR